MCSSEVGSDVTKFVLIYVCLQGEQVFDSVLKISIVVDISTDNSSLVEGQPALQSYSTIVKFILVA